MHTVNRRRCTSKPTTFTIVFAIGEDSYNVFPLAAHPEVAKAAYRFRKLTGDLAVYDVRLTLEGQGDFSRPGCTFHGKPCKHIRSLVAAGMMPKSVLEPVTSNEVY
jgi:hypothetical protein